MGGVYFSGRLSFFVSGDLGTLKRSDVEVLDRDRHIFVLDTNILVDYPDVIPRIKGGTRTFENPMVDLNGAHLVIPSAVVREMSSFKKENTDRGKSSREVLRNVRAFTEKSVRGMDSAYALESAVELPDGRLLSILPVHADFKGSLPFRPAEDDMDGQIILATLACMHLLECGSTDEIDWSNSNARLDVVSDKVTLLTNDNGLAIRARERGIVTSRYSYDRPKPYTGRREVIVPREVFLEFWNEKRLDRDVWEEFLPDEPKLVANEFIVMRLEDPGDYPLELLEDSNPYFRHIGRYDYLKDAIVGLRYVFDAPYEVRSEGQAMYTEALFDSQIAAVICTGPAGSGKTYLPTVYGIHACQKGKYLDMAIVPCANFGNLGALPGGLDEKMALDVGPIRNAIRNYLLNDDAHFRRELEKFQKNGVTLKYNDDEDSEVSLGDRVKNRVDQLWRMFFRNIPVEKARGLDFAYELAHYDEFQDQNQSQADMLIKRIGKGGKIIITGDIKQIHAPYLDEWNNGIVYASRVLYDSPMVARVSLLKEEVERHELVKLIAERQAEKYKAP